jgi:pantoate--beta-alanine ligase
MIIIKTAAALAAFIGNKKIAGKLIGFVPTMGALHQGHITLCTQCKAENDLTVCSIFINPTQFNNAVDFEKYPKTIEADIDMLEKNRCDLLFLPPVNEIYPPDTVKDTYNLGYLETVLEGKYRPGHFQGVCQVVDRLLRIVQPDTLYLGQKDYQQCMVIKKLVSLKNFHTGIRISETIREADGLAMSSRNTRLNPTERKQAVKIFETLTFIKHHIKPGSLEKIKQEATAYLNGNGFKVDYVEIADASDLALLRDWDAKTKLVILIAAYLNEVRLIDNLLVE